DIAQLFEFPHRLVEFRREGHQLVEIVALERVLIFRVALPPAHAHVLHRGEEKLRAGNVRSLRPEPGDDVLRRRLALTEWLERDEHARGVAAAPATTREGNDILNRRIFLDNAHENIEFFNQRVEGDILRGLDVPAEAAG